MKQQQDWSSTKGETSNPEQNVKPASKNSSEMRALLCKM
jgi:hypothetical protein